MTDTIDADLILLHAPSVFDFRERDDLIFSYLSDSDSVNVTGVYEMFPLGFFSLKSHLRAHGLKVEIVNVASLMLQHPTLDVDKLLSHLRAPVFGVDLHWMPHCHGSIELMKRVKHVHPDSVTIMGGISSTYFAPQIVKHDAIDVVIKGYDTLEPVRALVEMVKRNERNWPAIANAVYRDRVSGDVVENAFEHKPASNYNDAVVDWSFYTAPGQLLASRQIMTLPNTGCAHDCNWCGGSRFAYQNTMGVKKTLITKDIVKIGEELRTLPQPTTTSIYALQCYSESKPRTHEYLRVVREQKIKSVFFEQFNLTDDATLKEMGRSTKPYIMLSPESHDIEVSKLAGRGTYSMDEMEAWIPRALDAGVVGVMIWFFIGMQKQTAQSVLDTVDYSQRILEKFKGKLVLPLLCPMVPFLDPGSRFFEQPAEHGYKIFHKTLDEHRAAMVEPSWHRRLNYETEWMTRKQIRDVSYEAIARLVRIKGDLGVLPDHIARGILEKIDETLKLLADADRALELDGKFSSSLRDTIRAYNKDILAYSSDQITPMERPFGGRWFDDFTVSKSIIEACCTRGAAA